MDDDYVISMSFSEMVTNHGFYVKTAATRERRLRDPRAERHQFIRSKKET